MEGVGLNPTRTGFFDILRRAGAEVTATIDDTSTSEPTGRLRVRHKDLASFAVEPEEVPGVIDEIPALAALAAMLPAGSSMTVRGAGELRVKESDRIAMLAQGFRHLGSDVEEYDDGFTLRARPLAPRADLDAADDHRLAMAFMLAATRAAAPVTIHRVAVGVSYPEFLETFGRVTA